MLKFKKINGFSYDISLGIFYVGGLVLRDNAKWTIFLSSPSKMNENHHRQIADKLDELNANT